MGEVKPFFTTRTVKPFECGEGFSLSATETDLFKSIAQEHVNIIGTAIQLFHQDVSRGTRDPLYDEPIHTEFKGPFAMKAFVEWADSIAEAREEGFKTSFNSVVWISLKELQEKRSPFPSEGDVIGFWKTPFFDEWAVNDLPLKHRGYYFDVIDVDEDGHMFDNPDFVGVRLTIRRRTEFAPERRMDF